VHDREFQRPLANCRREFACSGRRAGAAAVQTSDLTDTNIYERLL